jgi:hypothetical protein
LILAGLPVYLFYYHLVFGLAGFALLVFIYRLCGDKSYPIRVYRILPHGKNSGKGFQGVPLKRR